MFNDGSIFFKQPMKFDSYEKLENFYKLTKWKSFYFVVYSEAELLKLLKSNFISKLTHLRRDERKLVSERQVQIAIDTKSKTIRMHFTVYDDDSRQSI